MNRAQLCTATWPIHQLARRVTTMGMAKVRAGCSNIRVVTSRNIRGTALLLAASLCTQPASAQPDADLGRRLVMQGDGLGSAPCMTCHGADGAGMAAAGFPSLALLQPGYMVKQLQDIQSGARASAIMAPIVASLTPAQMDAVSHYYASQQPAAVASTEGNAAVLARGEQLVNDGDWARYVVPCASCHGPGNSGVGDEFPALAGQNAAYLKQQLLAWQTGSRNNDPQQLMLAIAERLSPADIDAVAEYLSRLPVSRLSAGAP